MSSQYELNRKLEQGGEAFVHSEAKKECLPHRTSPHRTSYFFAKIASQGDIKCVLGKN